MTRAGTEAIRRVRDRRELRAPFEGTSSYARFLPVLLRRAVDRGHPAWVAVEHGRVVGAAVHDSGARTTSVFTREGRLVGPLAGVETSSPLLTEVASPDVDFGDPPTTACRLLERHPHAPEDVHGLPEIVPMRRDDLPEVERLAGRIHGARGPAWVRQCFEDGDLAFTARANGVARGFAFATPLGDEAWLHTSAVDPSCRGQGLGRGLMSARLCTLDAMGVERAVVEVAPENGPSMHLTEEFGFRPFAVLHRFERCAPGPRNVHERGGS